MTKNPMLLVFLCLVAGVAGQSRCNYRFDGIVPDMGLTTGHWLVTLVGSGFFEKPKGDCTGLQAVTFLDDVNLVCQDLTIYSDSIATCFAPVLLLNEDLPALVTVSAFFEGSPSKESTWVQEPSCGDGFTTATYADASGDLYEERCDFGGLGCNEECRCNRGYFETSPRTTVDCVDCAPLPQVDLLTTSELYLGRDFLQGFSVHLFDPHYFIECASKTDLYLLWGAANCAARQLCPGCLAKDFAQDASQCFSLELLALSTADVSLLTSPPGGSAPQATDSLTALEHLVWEAGVNRGDLLTPQSPIRVTVALGPKPSAGTWSRYTWVPRLRYWDSSVEDWVPAVLTCPPHLRAYDLSEDEQLLSTTVCRLGEPTVFKATWEVEKDIWFETFVGARDCQPPVEWQNRNLLDLDYPKMVNDIRPPETRHIRKDNIQYQPPLWCFDIPSTQSTTAANLLRTMDMPVAVLWAENAHMMGFPEDQALETRPFSTAFVDFAKWRVYLEFDTTFLPGPGATASIEAAKGENGWVHVWSFGGELDDKHVLLDVTEFHSFYNDITNDLEGTSFNRLRFRWRGNGQFGWFLDNVRVFLMSSGCETPALVATRTLANVFSK